VRLSIAEYGAGISRCADRVPRVFLFILVPAGTARGRVRLR